MLGSNQAYNPNENLDNIDFNLIHVTHTLSIYGSIYLDNTQMEKSNKQSS